MARRSIWQSWFLVQIVVWLQTNSSQTVWSTMIIIFMSIVNSNAKLLIHPLATNFLSSCFRFSEFKYLFLMSGECWPMSGHVGNICEFPYFISLTWSRCAVKFSELYLIEFFLWLQVMCFYFVFTVFSTVGFGDIYAVNTAERVKSRHMSISNQTVCFWWFKTKHRRVEILLGIFGITVSSVDLYFYCFLQIFCIFLFLAGSSLFGTLLAQVFMKFSLELKIALKNAASMKSFWDFFEFQLNDIMQTITREGRCVSMTFQFFGEPPRYSHFSNVEGIGTASHSLSKASMPSERDTKLSCCLPPLKQGAGRVSVYLF